jgi:hypothetical protein
MTKSVAGGEKRSINARSTPRSQALGRLDAGPPDRPAHGGARKQRATRRGGVPAADVTRR